MKASILNLLSIPTVTNNIMVLGTSIAFLLNGKRETHYIETVNTAKIIKMESLHAFPKNGH